MIQRQLKSAFFTLTGPLMWLNGELYRHLRAPSSGVMKVQLGPGRLKYLLGWINVDANMFTGKCDVWADLRNDLPFRDGTVDIFYSHHVIEHLPDLQHHFNEMFRCLKPGGAIRVGGPHGDNAVQKFIEGDAGWFDDFPDKRSSIGGRLDNFIFCRREHLAILTLSYLEELATNAGFTAVRACVPVEETSLPQWIDSHVLSGEHESTPDCPHTLIIETIKP